MDYDNYCKILENDLNEKGMKYINWKIKLNY